MIHLISCLPFDVFGVALGELVYLRQAVNEARPKISPCGQKSPRGFRPKQCNYLYFVQHTLQHTFQQIKLVCYY